MKTQRKGIYTTIRTSGETVKRRSHLSLCVNIKLILYILYISQSFGLAQSQTTLSQYHFCHRTHDIPAYAPFTEQSAVGFMFRNDFCVAELMYKSLELHLLHDGNVFHLRTSHDGYARFGEVRVDAGYGRRFGQRLSISLTGTYIARHAEHYRSRHSFTVDVSAYCQISPQWGVAVGLFNPIRMRYGITGQEVIPMSFSLDILHRRDEKLLFFLQARKELPGGFDAGIGLCYQPSKYLILNGNCSLRHIGIGICVPWHRLLISIQSEWHYRISFSNAVSAHYLFNL